MPTALHTVLGLTGYMTLFAAVGIVFLFVNMLVGRFLRPHNPSTEKLEIYECGEPTIGSGFMQFDLRFYVVALLFIIFDVEVAFFFPWATVFGKAMHLADKQTTAVAAGPSGEVQLTKSAVGLYRELGVARPTPVIDAPETLRDAVAGVDKPLERAAIISREGARQLAWVTIVDIVAFFAVLMVGFAYVWKRGDLDWVRAVTRGNATRSLRARSGDPLEEEEQMVAV